MIFPQGWLGNSDSIFRLIVHLIFSLKLSLVDMPVAIRSDEWDAIMFSMTISFMIAFFLEPVLEGLPIIFGAFCYLCGVMKGRRERIYEDEV